MKKSAYYELSQDQRKDTEIIFALEESSYPSHFHKKPEITYITQGNCNSFISQTEYFVEEDDILYVPEYYPHSYETSNNAKRLLLIPIPEYKIDIENLLSNKTFPCLLSNREYNRTIILPILNDMLTIQQNADIDINAKKLLLKSYTNIFYARIYDEYGNNLVDRIKQVELLTNVFTYIEEHYKENVTLDELANKFGYNKYYFSKIFNSCVGDNLKNYVNNIRIKKFTQIYSKDTTANITHLALSLGFDSMPPFYRAFNRFYHCSPKEYFSPPPES